ncbi:MAG: dihydroorotate dehydrogenase electron transfer subunit [Promethearchaeota archaeon]
MTENTIQTVKIQRIINECEGVNTLTFNMRKITSKRYIHPNPGQFVMVWVPGVDEIPMSISGYDDQGNWTITVRDVGECTKALNNLEPGDYIGIRGPLGNHFIIPEDQDKEIFLIGGGIGTAALKSLSSELFRMKKAFIFIEGAKKNNDLLYMDEFQLNFKEFVDFHYCTDDGSYGKAGFTTDVFKDLLNKTDKKNYSNIVVYSCGPEAMLYELFQICEKYDIEFYASLERIMRCGCGLCGLCTLDPIGLLVCKDGPIFERKELRELKDFGNYKREFTGKKVKID